jgi:hypothetical protein
MNKEQWCPICGVTVNKPNAKKGEDLYCDDCNRILDGYEFKHFCDNPNCPNHNLPLNDEKHYHSSTEGVIGGNCGILQTHKYYYKKVVPITKSKNFIFQTTSHKVEEKIIHLCDICHGAVQFYKEFNNE